MDASRAAATKCVVSGLPEKRTTEFVLTVADRGQNALVAEMAASVRAETKELHRAMVGSEKSDDRRRWMMRWMAPRRKQFVVNFPVFHTVMQGPTMKIT